MNERSRRQRGALLLRDAMGGALDGRLLALFTAVVFLTTMVAALPAWRVLAGALDDSPRAVEFARAFDPLAFEDVAMAFARQGAPIAGASLAALILAALSWPLLAGMAIGAAHRAERRTFASLLAGGIHYYTRMLRIGLVAMGPLLALGGVVALVYRAAGRHARHAILESQGNLGYRVALAVSLLLFAVVHATLELGRAAYGADDDLRSGWQAWLRGVVLTARHPLRVLGAYAGTTLAGYAVALPLLVLRLRVSGSGAAELIFGFVLAQLAVAALGWGRAARLFAFTALSRGHSPLSLTPADARDAVPADAHAVSAPSIASRPGAL
jgi:hypothetical protein